MMYNRLVHTPEGVRDIYGQEYARKLSVQKLIHRQFGLYGYEDIQTPAFEYFDVFSREIGTTPSKELYKFFDKEGNTLVLRPDFTPSMARCAAKYFMEEEVPIRFCYQGNTFTNTGNLQGKLKEVTQMIISVPWISLKGRRGRYIIPVPSRRYPVLRSSIRCSADTVSKNMFPLTWEC